jgi:hypothetical protein
VDRDRGKDMKIKITVLTLCALLLALSFSAEAQQQAKVPKIGISHLLALLHPLGSSYYCESSVNLAMLRART